MHDTRKLFRVVLIPQFLDFFSEVNLAWCPITKWLQERGEAPYTYGRDSLIITVIREPVASAKNHNVVMLNSSDNRETFAVHVL